ncbi:MAG TPA: ThuA domain-containing protein [Bacteroidales bacterium]|nr:ThuA domain-containing protein [Bacteroidales bacterium]
MKQILSILLAVLITLPSCSQNKPAILIFSKTKGYYHESIPAGIKCITEACAKEGIQVDTTKDASLFTESNLKKYKAVVFLNTSGDVLNEEQQKAFINYIHSGGGYLGIHAALDTEYDWPWYNQLAGAWFLSHPAQQKATINVTDKNNPATSMLPDKWTRTDEWYNFKNISSDIKVLAWLDESSYTGGANGEKHPFIWCHEFEGGRAFYTGVGHRDDNYDEPLVQQHLLGAVLWTAGLKK